MQLNTATEALDGLAGGTFVGLDTLTQVSLKGGRKNPQQGRITKRMTGAQVMCFSNTNGSAYDAMVRRRLEQEGRDPNSFELSPRAWGQRVPGTSFVEHKGQVYLEVIALRAGKVEYLLDGQPISKNDIDGLEEGRAGEQAGLENKVIVRTFALDSITAMRAITDGNGSESTHASTPSSGIQRGNDTPGYMGSGQCQPTLLRWESAVDSRNARAIMALQARSKLMRNDTLTILLNERQRLLDRMDAIVADGGRLLCNDPLMLRYNAIGQRVARLRKLLNKIG